MSQSPRNHRQAWDLIPWIVNGTASDTEREAVDAHLRECPECREELRFQRNVQAAVVAEPQIEPAEGWTRLQARLDGGGRRARRGSIARGPTMPFAFARGGWAVALVAVVVLEALGIGALGMALWSTQRPSAGPPVYRTLASPQQTPGSPTIRIVLAPTMSLGELQRLLRQTGLQVVEGPTESGVWSLAPSGASSQAATEAAVRELRANPSVRFAEAVGAAP